LGGFAVSLHKEISFETKICEQLGAHGRLYAEGDAANYDQAQVLFSEDCAGLGAIHPAAGGGGFAQEPRGQRRRNKAARPPALPA